MWKLNAHEVRFDSRGNMTFLPNGVTTNPATVAFTNNVINGLQLTPVQQVQAGGNAVWQWGNQPTGQGFVNGAWSGTFTFWFASYSRALTNIQSSMTIFVNWGYDPGGIAGVLDGGIVRRSFNSGQINGEVAGGIVGTVTGGGRVEDVYNTGTVSGINANSLVGGIIGHLEEGSIDRAYSTGAVRMISAAPNASGEYYVVADRDRMRNTNMGALVGLFGAVPRDADGNVIIDRDANDDIINVDTSRAFLGQRLFYDRAGVAINGVQDVLWGIGRNPASMVDFGRTTTQMRTIGTFTGFYVNQFIPIQDPDENLRSLNDGIMYANQGLGFEDGHIWTQNALQSPLLQGISTTAQPVPVRFFGNGGALEFFHDQTVWTLAHTNISMAQAPRYVLTGHTFMGFANRQVSVAEWAGTGLTQEFRNQVTSGAFLRNISGPTDLFAVWQVTDFSVRFILGDGAHTGGGALNQNVAFGSRPQAPLAARDGHFLLGWENGAGNFFYSIPVEGHDGQLPAQPASDVIYFARWRPNITVIFHLDGGTVTAGSATQTVAWGGEVTAPEVSRPGWVLVGWDEAEMLKSVEIYNPALQFDTLHVNAQWVPGDWTPGPGNGGNGSGNGGNGSGNITGNPGGPGTLWGVHWGVWLLLVIIVLALLAIACILIARTVTAKKGGNGGYGGGYYG
jgi:hypothetical protein